MFQDQNLENVQAVTKKDFQNLKKEVIRNTIDKEDNMTDLPKIKAEAKEIIKNKRTGKIYASKEEFDADVLDPNTDTVQEDLRQDLEVKVPNFIMGALTKK